MVRMTKIVLERSTDPEGFTKYNKECFPLCLYNIFGTISVYTKFRPETAQNASTYTVRIVAETNL